MRRADEEHPSGDPRFALIDRTLKRFQFQQDALIEVLHTAQEAFGYLTTACSSMWRTSLNCR